MELLLANLLADQRATQAGLRSRLYVATKANPFKDYNKDLRPSNVVAQLQASLSAMEADSVDLFYLHAPDLSTPIEATLEACQTLFEQGKFRELGLSNYPAWEVVRIYHLCKERGWVVPTVYQVRGRSLAVLPWTLTCLLACFVCLHMSCVARSVNLLFPLYVQPTSPDPAWQLTKRGEPGEL